jgi:hypothetical protein
MIYTEGPVATVDWDEVDFIRCTLESPYGKGGLRFRLGTKDAKRNLSWEAGREEVTGPQYHPGAPIMFPEDKPAVPGDSWLMAASISAMTQGRNGQPIPDGARHAGFVAFGFFMAPLLATPRIVGFTQSTERERIAAFWHQFKYPSNRATANEKKILMARIASPDVPDVSVRPLDRQMQPVKDAAGNEVVIRVREFWNFNDPSQYEVLEDAPPALAPQSEIAKALEGLSVEDIRALVAIARKGGAGGKQ